MATLSQDQFAALLDKIKPVHQNSGALANLVPAFDGTSDIKQWLKVVEQIRIMGNWNSEQTVGIIKIKATGVAADFLWKDDCKKSNKI
jgi:hypothetical protein